MLALVAALTVSVPILNAGTRLFCGYFGGDPSDVRYVGNCRVLTPGHVAEATPDMDIILSLNNVDFRPSRNLPQAPSNCAVMWDKVSGIVGDYRTRIRAILLRENAFDVYTFDQINTICREARRVFPGVPIGTCEEQGTLNRYGYPGGCGTYFDRSFFLGYMSPSNDANWFADRMRFVNNDVSGAAGGLPYVLIAPCGEGPELHLSSLPGQGWFPSFRKPSATELFWYYRAAVNNPRITGLLFYTYAPGQTLGFDSSIFRNLLTLQEEIGWRITANDMDGRCRRDAPVADDATVENDGTVTTVGDFLPHLSVGDYEDGGKMIERRGVVEFSFAPIPRNASIVRATLMLLLGDAGDRFAAIVGTAPTDVHVDLIAGDGDVTTTDFDRTPLMTDIGVLLKTGEVKPHQWCTLDVTDAARAIWKRGDDYCSFRLEGTIPTNKNGTPDFFRFSARETYETRPVLRIEFTLPGFSVVTDALPNASVGHAYETWLTALQGAFPYTWDFEGTLPNGLFFTTETGRLFGTPTAGGRFPATFIARDQNGNAARRTLTLMVGN